MITAHLGRRARARAHRRRARLARRQPADPPRLLAHPRARLAADADDRARRSCGRSTGSTRTRGPSQERAGGAMSVIFSRAPLRDLARRRRHRPALLLPRARRLPRRRGDRQVRLHAHPHGLPAPLPDEVLARLEEVDEIAEIRHPILRESAAAPLARQPARDRLGRRRPGRHRAWAPPARSRSACSRRWRIARRDVDHAGRARRGGVRDRDRRPRRAGRQAGPVRRRARRDLRLHVQPRRHASTSSRSSSPGRRCERLRDNLLLFYTGEARSASAVLADQDERTEERRRGDAREPRTGRRRWALEVRELLAAGDLEAYAELMHEHWQNKRVARPAWRPSGSTTSTRSRAAAA